MTNHTRCDTSSEAPTVATEDDVAAGTTFSGAAANTTFPHPAALLSAPGAIFNDGTQFDHNRQPYIMQWNLSVQREVLPSTLVGVSYVGTRGLFLNRQGDMNVAIPTIQTDGRYFYPAGSVRRDPNFQRVWGGA